MAIFLKDPAAVVDYAIDWAGGYLDGRTIAASQWHIEPAGVAIAGTVIEPQRTVATLAGGIAGNVHRITNSVTLSDGRSDERTLVVRVENR